MFEARVAGEGIPADAPDAVSMRLGTGPGQRAPGSLLVLTTPDPFDPVFSVATQWSRSEQDAALLSLAEYEAREVLILSSLLAPRYVGAVKLVAVRLARWWTRRRQRAPLALGELRPRHVPGRRRRPRSHHRRVRGRRCRVGSGRTNRTLRSIGQDIAAQALASYVDADSRLARISRSGEIAQTVFWIEPGEVTRIAFEPFGDA